MSSSACWDQRSASPQGQLEERTPARTQRAGKGHVSGGLSLALTLSVGTAPSTVPDLKAFCKNSHNTAFLPLRRSLDQKTCPASHCWGTAEESIHLSNSSGIGGQPRGPTGFCKSLPLVTGAQAGGTGTTGRAVPMLGQQHILHATCKGPQHPLQKPNKL